MISVPNFDTFPVLSSLLSEQTVAFQLTLSIKEIDIIVCLRSAGQGNHLNTQPSFEHIKTYVLCFQ